MSKLTAVLFAAALAVPSVAVSQEPVTPATPVLIGSLTVPEVTALAIGLATFGSIIGGGGSSSSSTAN